MNSLAGPPLDTQVRAPVTGSKVRDIMDGLPDENIYRHNSLNEMND